MRKSLKPLAFLAVAASVPSVAEAAHIVTPVAQTVTSYSVEDGIAYKFRGNLIQGSIYQLVFAAQGNADSLSPNWIDVSIHGKSVFSVAPTGSGFQDYSTTFKYYGDNTIVFSGMDSQGLAAGIDNVRVSLVAVSSVPEPATWAMMLLGVGMTGGAMRAKRRSVGQRSGSALPAS
jgi:hypothetical protein